MPFRRIGELNVAEKAARGLPPDERAEILQAEAKPDFNNLEAWLNAQPSERSGKTPLATATRFAVTWTAQMRPYLDHRILEIDDTAAGRAMRVVALASMRSCHSAKRISVPNRQDQRRRP